MNRDQPSRASEHPTTLVVRRGLSDFYYGTLAYVAASTGVRIIVDRRSDDRRTTELSTVIERRAGDRRHRAPDTWQLADFVLVPPSSPATVGSGGALRRAPKRTIGLRALNDALTRFARRMRRARTSPS